MTNRYESPAVRIRAADHRVIVTEHGRVEYQYRAPGTEAWRPFALYSNPRFGLVTLADLNERVYAPNRAAIEAARGAPVLERYTLAELAARVNAQTDADRAEQERRLRAIADAMAEDFQLTPPASPGLQFNLI